MLGLLIGVTLFVTSPSGIRPLRWVNLPLGLYVNISRSLPFLILLIVLIPMTRFIVGTSLGATAAIVPLTFGTAPFFGRLVETALREVEKGKVEAAEAMGATHGEIVRKVLLPEALPALLAGVTLTLVMFVDYSAMAGAIGAGGLGTFAIKYGYQRFNTELMLVTVVILVVIVQDHPARRRRRRAAGRPPPLTRPPGDKFDQQVDLVPAGVKVASTSRQGGVTANRPPPARVCRGGMWEDLIAAAVGLALVGYLLYALVRPDRF